MKRWNKGLMVFSAAVITCVSSLPSCTTVKPYQKNRLNDSEMTLSPRLSQKFEQSFELYREVASGGNGGKSGGGCGCN